MDDLELCRGCPVGIRVDDRPDSDAGEERVGGAFTVSSCSLANPDDSYSVSSAPDENVKDS